MATPRRILTDLDAVLLTADLCGYNAVARPLATAA